MTFAWPWALLGLAGVPVLVAAYGRLLRRAAARRAELAALGLVSSAPPRRHLGPVLFLVALALLVVAVARPEATVSTPRREGTVLLAFDVSASMAATDIAPTRIAAAKSAARAFVERQPAQVRIGVIAFSTSAVVTQQPTVDRSQALAAIDRLTPQGGTALGRGLLTSLSVITGTTVLASVPDSDTAQGQDLGYHASSAVVLLSDGENTDEPDPVEMAQLASTAGVRVYPVGVGSPAGTVLEVDGFQVATALDEPVLREIAQTTDGEYFAAADRQALADVYSSIDLAFTVESERVEVTGLFAAAAGLLLLVGAALSLLRSGRVV